ncbi:hypothetical protein AUK45_02540 [Candidatus Peregrinibacteria bacterium CG2_30_44_17]|nr:MAG: hypothetical protein AUK45_02540 [Candidatus Peregrinibacteria bacterium CG2_30_44_17]
MPDESGFKLDQDDSLDEDKKDGAKPEVSDAHEDDDEIGVQKIQKEVHAAASAHAGGTMGELQDSMDITRDVDSFSSKIDDVLQDAGLTRKHVYFCCGGIVVIFVLFMIVFFGVKFFVGFIGNEDSDISDNGDVVVEVPDTTDDTTSDSADDGQVWVDPSLYGGILLGVDFGIEGQTGAQEGVDVGEVVTTYDDEFSYQIEHYGKVLNALEFDVNDYLNNYQDRGEAVDDLLYDLEALYEDGKEIIGDLEYTIADLETTFNGNLDTKQLYEDEFFAQLTSQDGNDTVAALNSFVEISQEQVDIKAHYQARQKLYDLLYSALLYLNARIDDITLNREALVKGVQVVDIRGSDLELIVEEDLE